MIQSAAMVLRSGTKMLVPVLGDGAARDGRLLMAHTLGIAPDRLTLELNRMLTPQQVSQFEYLIRRRLDREPVSQITGGREFWGRRFRVTSDVLDPRPETETLVARALEHGPSACRILDLGTGSGCILLTLLAEWSGPTGVGVDCSAAALDVAAQNADSLGLSDRVAFRQSDWFEGVEGKFNLVVSNPPYIADAEMNDLAPEVRDWEPRQALTPGGDGLAAYRTIAAGLSQHLSPGGRALLEFGAGQGDAVLAIFAAAGFDNAELIADMDGRPRIAEIHA